MSYEKGKNSWKGCDDGFPTADPKGDNDPPTPKGGDWKGMDDGTPKSKPTDPNES